MTPLTTAIEALTERIRLMPENKRITERMRSGDVTLVARRRGELVVVTSWRVMDGHDDDYESVRCGCPLTGEAHRHYEYRTADDADAARAFTAADGARRQRKSTHGLPDGALPIVE